MLGGSIEEVNDKADIGIMSDPSVAGGLPAPDIEVPEIEGEREYARPSFARGTLIEAGMRPWDEDEDP
jgi:hypothetical protein